MGQHSCDQELWWTKQSSQGRLNITGKGPTIFLWVVFLKQLSGPTLSTSSESPQCHPVLEGPPGALRNGPDIPSPAAWHFLENSKGRYSWDTGIRRRPVTSSGSYQNQYKGRGRGAFNTEGRLVVCKGQSWYFLIEGFRGWSHLGRILDGASGTGA